MGKWFSFFLSTPKRFLGTCAGIALIVAIIEPSLVHIAAARLFEAINPLIGPLLQLLIIGAGIKIMFSWLSGGGRKKK